MRIAERPRHPRHERSIQPDRFECGRCGLTRVAPAEPVPRPRGGAAGRTSEPVTIAHDPPAGEPDGLTVDVAAALRSPGQRSRRASPAPSTLPSARSRTRSEHQIEARERLPPAAPLPHTSGSPSLAESENEPPPATRRNESSGRLFSNDRFRPVSTRGSQLQQVCVNRRTPSASGPETLHNVPP